MTSAAIIFPGQGSHREGMADDLRDAPAIARGLELLDYDPFERLAEGTRYQQPAVFLCSIAQWQLEQPPAIVAAGHSLGEYAALVAAGAVDFEPALELVDERAAAMAHAASLTPSGMTVLLKGDLEAIRKLADELGLLVANDNSPGQVVLAGSIPALERAEERAKDETGARAQRLDVSGAFHSPLMAPAAERLKAALERTSEARECSGRALEAAYADGSPLLQVRALELHVKLTGSAGSQRTLRSLQEALSA